MSISRTIAASAGIVLFCTGIAVAQDSDFTFKRVKPPAPGQKKLITVQIEPTVPDIKPVEVGKTETPMPYAWFWNALPDESEAIGPGRLEPAIETLRNPPAGEGLKGPSLQAMLDVIKAHRVDMLIHTIDKQVSPALVLAVIMVESSGRADAVSSAGAQGLMQLMPATADRFGVTDAFNSSDNIRAGVTYLDWLLKEFDGDPILALAGYNAGENAVKKHGGVPPFPETQAYVPKVLNAYALTRALCTTLPILVSDGCVFQVEG